MHTRSCACNKPSR